MVNWLATPVKPDEPSHICQNLLANLVAICKIHHLMVGTCVLPSTRLPHLKQWGLRLTDISDVTP